MRLQNVATLRTLHRPTGHHDAVLVVQQPRQVRQRFGHLARSGAHFATVGRQTSAKSGGGRRPRHRFDSVHVALRMHSGDRVSSSMLIGNHDMHYKRPHVAHRRMGGSASCASTKSRSCGESAAMLPSAHTACANQSRHCACPLQRTCSRSFSGAARSSSTSTGTASSCTTAWVCALLPDVTFTTTNAASSCIRSALDGPRRTRLDLEVGRGEEEHDARQQANVQDHLDGRRRHCAHTHTSWKQLASAQALEDEAVQRRQRRQLRGALAVVQPVPNRLQRVLELLRASR